MTGPVPLSSCICLCSPSFTKRIGTVGEARIGQPNVKLGTKRPLAQDSMARVRICSSLLAVGSSPAVSTGH